MLLSSGWRAFHIDLVRSIALVDGRGQGLPSDYNNVVVIVDVLDSYRTLVEMARICFCRLGELLEREDARKAAKAVESRIMDHALWALVSYADDVDLQLVRMGWNK